MTVLMLISMIFIPIFQSKLQKNQKKKYEEKRQTRYREYINEKIREIDRIMKEQKEILLKNYVNEEECSNIILSKSSRLWERKKNGSV